MGIAVMFVEVIATAVTWAVNEFLLVPLNLVYMQTVVFILVIAALVQLVEMFLQKAVPALYQALGIYLPLITTNCAVLGVALLNIQDGYNFVESLVYGITGGIGFTVAILCSPPCASAWRTATARRPSAASRSRCSPPVCWPCRSWASPACQRYSGKEVRSHERNSRCRC